MTAAASVPQMSFAPDEAKRSQRRLVYSPGAPSLVQSQPSMGRIAQRFPGVLPQQESGEDMTFPGTASDASPIWIPSRRSPSRKPERVWKEETLL